MKKSKLVYALMAALILNVFTPVVAAAKVTDVSVDHWAYHAVDSAVTKGYLTVFEDGTFQGTRTVDRYTLATVVARLLEDIEVSRVRGTSGDLVEISELRIRFEEDLATWYADQQSLRDQLKQIDTNALVAEDRVNRVVGAQGELMEQVEDIRSQVLVLQNNLTDIQAGVGIVQGQLQQHTGDISEYDQRLTELVNAVVQLEKEIILQAEAIGGLENWAGEKGAVFATLQSTDSQITADLAELTELNQQLEKDLQNVAVMLQRETQKRTELAQELEKARAEIVVLRNDTSGLDEIKGQLSTDVNAQINAALIREQRLERQIKSIEEEFESYRATAEKDVKSAKTLATVGIALGAIGAIIGFISMGAQ